MPLGHYIFESWTSVDRPISPPAKPGLLHASSLASMWEGPRASQPRHLAAPSHPGSPVLLNINKTLMILIIGPAEFALKLSKIQSMLCQLSAEMRRNGFYDLCDNRDRPFPWELNLIWFCCPVHKPT